MMRKCVICGKEFSCSPSDKTVTCSKECSRINKSKTHVGKKNIWSEESREKLKKLGQTENLKKGTVSQEKIWILTSPEKKQYICKNLRAWAREHCDLFGLDTSEENAQRIASGLSQAKCGKTVTTYKGWTAQEGTVDDYKQHGYPTQNMIGLSDVQRKCVVDRANGLSCSEIAERHGLSKAMVYYHLKRARRLMEGLPALTDQEKENQKKSARKHYQSHKQQYLDNNDRYYAKNPDRIKEYRRKYYEEHKEELKAKQREYNKKYYQENRERILSRKKEKAE